MNISSISWLPCGLAASCICLSWSGSVCLRQFIAIQSTVCMLLAVMYCHMGCSWGSIMFLMRYAWSGSRLCPSKVASVALWPRCANILG